MASQTAQTSTSLCVDDYSMEGLVSFDYIFKPVQLQLLQDLESSPQSEPQSCSTSSSHQFPDSKNGHDINPISHLTTVADGKNHEITIQNISNMNTSSQDSQLSLSAPASLYSFPSSPCSNSTAATERDNQSLMDNNSKPSVHAHINTDPSTVRVGCQFPLTRVSASCTSVIKVAIKKIKRKCVRSLSLRRSDVRLVHYTHVQRRKKHYVNHSSAITYILDAENTLETQPTKPCDYDDKLPTPIDLYNNQNFNYNANETYGPYSLLDDEYKSESLAVRNINAELFTSISQNNYKYHNRLSAYSVDGFEIDNCHFSSPLHLTRENTRMQLVCTNKDPSLDIQDDNTSISAEEAGEDADFKIYDDKDDLVRSWSLYLKRVLANNVHKRKEMAQYNSLDPDLSGTTLGLDNDNIITKDYNSSCVYNTHDHHDQILSGETI